MWILAFNLCNLPYFLISLSTDRLELLCNINNNNDSKCKFLTLKSNATPEKERAIKTPCGSSSHLSKASRIFLLVLQNVLSTIQSLDRVQSMLVAIQSRNFVHKSWQVGYKVPILVSEKYPKYYNLEFKKLAPSQTKSYAKQPSTTN